MFPRENLLYKIQEDLRKCIDIRGTFLCRVEHSTDSRYDQRKLRTSVLPSIVPRRHVPWVLRPETPDDVVVPVNRSGEVVSGRYHDRDHLLICRIKPFKWKKMETLNIESEKHSRSHVIERTKSDLYQKSSVLLLRIFRMLNDYSPPLSR